MQGPQSVVLQGQNAAATLMCTCGHTDTQHTLHTHSHPHTQTDTLTRLCPTHLSAPCPQAPLRTGKGPGEEMRDWYCPGRALVGDKPVGPLEAGAGGRQ